MSAGGGLQLGEHAFQPRLETALFGRSQLFGDGKPGEAHQSLLDLLQTPLEGCGGGGAYRIGWGGGPHRTQGRSKQLTAVRLVGHAVG